MKSSRVFRSRAAWCGGLFPLLLAGCSDRFVVGMNGHDAGPIVTGSGGMAGTGGAAGAGGSIGGRGGSATGTGGASAAGGAGAGGGAAGSAGGAAIGGRGGAAGTAGGIAGSAGTGGMAGAAGTGGMRPPPAPVDFLAGRAYFAGDTAYRVAIGDLNGDGRPDLVTGEGSNTSGVNVLLNNGNGFAPPMRIAIASVATTISLAIGDLDGDGRPDLAVTVAKEGRVAVLLNQGGGTFAAPVNITTGMNPVVVAIGDVNTDGRADLIVGTTQDLGVAFFINDGRGGFAAAGSHFFGETPGAVLVTDLNADGKQDVVIGGPPSPSPSGAIPFVSVLINDGTGQFTASVNRVGTEGGVVALAAGDLDGDGRSDLLAVGDEEFMPNLGILRNTGAAVPFASPAVMYTAGRDVAGARIGDMNGDGRNDVVFVTKFGGSVTVWLKRAVSGLPADAFNALDPFFGGYAPAAMVLGDVNGDGRLDVAFADEFDAGVLFGTGGGALSSSQSIPVAAALSGMTVADVNRDGRLDLIGTRASGEPGDASVFVTLGRAGGFGATTDYVAGIDASAIAAADLDGDGAVDLVIAEQDYSGTNVSNAMVMMNRGNGTFAPAVVYQMPEGVGSIELGNLGGDARPDLVTVNWSGEAIGVRINAGNGTFGAPMQFTVGPNPQGVAIADFDGDGRMDLATATSEDGDVLILSNLGNSALLGSPTLVATLGAPGAAYSLAARDLDRDGRPDLVVSSYYTPNAIIVLRNLGGGAFAARVDYPTSWGSGAPVVGDVNADGAPDIVVGGYSGKVDVLLNYGDGSFAPAIRFTVGNPLGSPVIGDFTGDGKLDLAAPHWGGDVRLLRNVTP